MSVLIDTNIIIDVVANDIKWAEWSLEQLEQVQNYPLIINPIIYSELAYGIPMQRELDNLIKEMGLIFEELPRAALFRASKAFKRYKLATKSRKNSLPDFFIGAHAEVKNYELLTRDTKRFKKYFPEVVLRSPQTV